MSPKPFHASEAAVFDALVAHIQGFVALKMRLDVADRADLDHDFFSRFAKTTDPLDDTEFLVSMMMLIV